jgi:peptidyl-tRNA hydrolase, PTH1 family
MFLVVGLGNPGEKYKNTRHNAGFIVLDKMIGNKDWRKSSSCDAFYRLDGEVGYLKPITMMNLSGRAVYCAMKNHDIKPENIIVIHDDIDLAFRDLKISFGSGDGGHKGIKSIINALGTKDFVRIRIGIAPTTLFGKTKKPNRVESFVLKNFPKKKIIELEKMSQNIKPAISKIISDGVESAMNEFN